MIWLLIGYMWLFIHRPFEVWPWLGEFRIERVYMIITILYWALFAEKRLNINRVNLGVFVLLAAMLLSTLASDYSATAWGTTQNWLKILVFYLLLVTSVRDKEDLKKLTIGFAVVFFLYLAHSFREYLCGRHVYRMGIKRMVGVDATRSNPNSFGASIVYSLPLAYVVWQISKTKLQKLASGAYFGLAGLCIYLTGSRSSFAALLVMVLSTVVLMKRRFLILVAIVVILPLSWFALPEDLQNRYWTLIDPSVGPANAQASAEGRMQGFLDGIENWKKRPIVGVGPHCHGLAVGHGGQAHNLYGQVLGETGLLGTLGLLLLILAYGLNWWEARQIHRELEGETDRFLMLVVHATAFSVLFLLFLGWGGHNLLRYNWIWYAGFQASAIMLLRDQRDAYDAESEP